MSKIKDLRHLARKDDDARKVFGWLCTLRRGDLRDDIEAFQQGANIEYSAAVRVAKALDEIGIGRFVHGRRGHKSRFEYWARRTQIGPAALGQSDTLSFFKQCDDESLSFDEMAVKLSVAELLEMHRRMIAAALKRPASEVQIIIGENG